jgi:hypothetical protein
LQMGTGITTVLRVGALSAVLLAGGATTSEANGPDAPAQSHPAPAAVSTHALSGVVKHVDATTLIVTRAGKSPGEITFVLSPSTHLDGAIGVGATVQVRFRTERDTMVATAVLATAPKRRAVPGRTP